MIKYTKEQVEFLKSIVPGHSYKEIVSMFSERFETQITQQQVNSFIGNRKLNTGRTGRFEKGQIPFNKGKKGVGGWIPTQFKKGNIPHNYKPIGTERISKDGYIEIKIKDPNKWRGKHVVIYEEKNGPIPKSHAVIFGDGNNRNFNIDNLILVSRKQLLMLNQSKLIKNSAELTRTAIIITDLYSKMSERKRG